MSECLLSLCIPTNGIIEWVIPVLDSIFSQNVNEELFEVCISDNGNSKEFEEIIQKYKSKYNNIKYQKTKNKLFSNEIDCYKMANGVFIKFVNHRTHLCNGKLNYLLDFVSKNMLNKPLVYFSNGALNNRKCQCFKDFDKYIRELGIYTTWSTGMAFWKEDFNKLIDLDFNSLFPHTNILFNKIIERDYIIDDSIILCEPEKLDMKKKGNYDVYYAFLVEFIKIIQKYLKKNIITIETYKKLKKDTLHFCLNLYIDYNILKRPNSYDVTHFRDNYSIYYKNYGLITNFGIVIVLRFCKKISSVFNVIDYDRNII